MRILIADRNPITRSILSSALGQHYSVAEAENGGQAVRYISDAHEYGEPFDVVVLDMELSAGADHDIVRFLKEMEEPRVLVGGRSSRVVLVSGGGSNADNERFGHKKDVPIDVTSVLNEIERVMGLA